MSVRLAKANLWRGWRKLLPAFLVGVLLLSGCASRKEVRKFQADHVEFRARMETIDTDLDRIEQRQKEIEKNVNVLRDLLGGNVSDYLKAQEELIRALRADQNAISGDLERQIVTMTSRFAESEDRLQKLITQLDTFNRLVAEVLGDSVAASAYAAVEAQQLFQQGYSDYLSGQMEVARMGFETYVQSYPSTPLADDALYWMGETYLAEASTDTLKLDSARAVFIQLADRYPESNRLATAMLKRGIIRARQGDVTGARRLFEQLVRTWPDTDEADQAQQWIADLLDTPETPPRLVPEKKSGGKSSKPVDY
ncbi:MAG: tetratricopeptide repeat protein [bacterium]